MLEEMRKNCGDCINFQDYIYWTRFNSMHFCQFVNGDFRSELMLPKKFSENMKGKLPQKVALRGPSGVSWDVRLVETDDALLLRDGWEEFSNVHLLKQNDILVFEYNGKSEFSVLIIDGESLCEREASCFVNKCGHYSNCSNQAQVMKSQRRECSVDIIQDSPPEDDNPDSIPTKKLPEKALADVDGSRLTRGRRKIIQDRLHEDTIEGSPSKRLRKEMVVALNHDGSPSVRGGRVKGLKVSTTGGKDKTPPRDIAAIEDKHHVTNLRYTVMFSSNRRPVTQEEKEAAYLKAQEDVTEKSFLVVMRSTHVYKRFYVGFPQNWLLNHLTKKKQDLKLRVNDKTWIVRVIFSSNGRVGLSRGWQKFSLDNFLEEFDVCLFKLASDACEQKKAVVLDVSIYRALPDEIVPPTRLTPLPMLRNK